MENNPWSSSGGKLCRSCSKSWRTEVLGCGKSLSHPLVLRSVVSMCCSKHFSWICVFIFSPAFHPGAIPMPVSEQLKVFFPSASFTSPLIQYKFVLENKFSFSLQKSFSYLKVIIVSCFSHFPSKLITTNNLNTSSW